MNYRHLQVLRISKSVSMNGLNGKVINLMSFDAYRFDNTLSLLYYLWKGPIEVIVFGYFLYREIGYYGWIGVGFILCFVPVQSEYNSGFTLIKMETYLSYYDFSLYGKIDGKLPISLGRPHR